MIYEPVAKAGINNTKFNYENCRLLDEMVVRKRAAPRHFGIHGYFTKQAWNVVQEYIKNFSQEGDLVFDPFGGSGVTAIEAMMTGRKVVHLDLNPMSVFLTKSLVAPVVISKLTEAFENIKVAFEKKYPVNQDEINRALLEYPYPKSIALPRDSDVETIEQLFSQKQLAQLSFLKYLIRKERDINCRETLMLMFSGIITKANLTYHTSDIATEVVQKNGTLFCIKNAKNGSKENQENSRILRA